MEAFEGKYWIIFNEGFVLSILHLADMMIWEVLLPAAELIEKVFTSSSIYFSYNYS